MMVSPSRHLGVWRSRRGCLLLLLPGLAVSTCFAGEKEKDPDNVDPGEIRRIEERKSELFRQSSEAFLKRAGHLEYLQERARQVKAEISLEEARSKKLDELVETTFEHLIELGIPAVEEQFARYSSSYQKGRLSDDRGVSRPVPLASMPELPDPLETTVWQEGLEKILTGQENRAWEKGLSQHLARQREEDRDRMDEILDFRKERDRTYLENWVTERTARTLADVPLSRGRENRFRAGGEQFLEESLETIRKLSVDELENATVLERRRILKTAPGRSLTQVRSESESEKMWSKIVADHLTPEELGKLKEASRQRREQNIESIARVAFCSLDRFLRFAVEQEESILPVFRERIRERLGQTSRAYLTPLSMSSLMSDLRNEDFRVKLENELTSTQSERLEILRESFGYFATVMDLTVVPDEGESDSTSRQIATEQLIATYMRERLNWEQERRVLPLLSIIEEMGREIGLTEEEIWNLEIAAKGAVTREIEPLNERLPASVRSQVERALNAGVDEQRIQVPMNLQSDHVTGEETGIWRNALESVLAGERRKAWDERERLRWEHEVETFVELALSEANQNLYLKPEQEEQIRPLVEKALRENLRYFKQLQIFSRNWFEFFSGGALIALKAIPEEERDFVFTTDQMELWHGKFENRLKGSWERIVRMKEGEKEDGEREQDEKERAVGNVRIIREGFINGVVNVPAP